MKTLRVKKSDQAKSKLLYAEDELEMAKFKAMSPEEQAAEIAKADPIWEKLDREAEEFEIKRLKAGVQEAKAEFQAAKAEDMAEWTERLDATKALRAVKLPEFKSPEEDGYIREVKSSTVWWSRGREGEAPQRLVSLFELMGAVMLADRGNAYCLVIDFLTPDLERETILIDVGDLAKGKGAEVIAQLRRAGMVFTDAGTKWMISYLMERQPRGALAYDRGGWRGGVFLPPAGPALLAEDCKRPPILSAEARLDCAPTTGTREANRQGVNGLFATTNRTCQAGFIMGTLGPMIGLMGVDSPTYLLEGGSSKGKSGAQMTAASSWTPAELNDGLFVSGNVTPTSVEPLLERAAAVVLCLDENRFLSAAVTHDIIFMVQQGAGKLRGRPRGGVQRQTKHRTVLIMSTETGMTQRLAAEGKTAAGGLSVRALAIDAENIPEPSAAEMADLRLIWANTGWTGPEMVYALRDQGYVANVAKLQAEVNEKAKLLAGSDESMAVRSAANAAYLWQAGVILQKAGIIPAAFDVERMVRSIWLEFASGDMAPVSPTKAAIARLIEELGARKGSEIVELTEDEIKGVKETADDSSIYRQRLGWIGTTQTGERVWIIRSSQIDKLSGGAAGRKALRQALRDGGYVLPFKPVGEIAFDGWPGLVRASYIVFKASAIECEGRQVVTPIAANDKSPEKPEASKGATVSRAPNIRKSRF